MSEAPVGYFPVGHLLAQGRYRIENLLGEGGMGAVYLATETSLDRHVALKVLHPELTAHPTARRRMEQEARALARVSSAHVVRVNTVFEEDGLLIIDLEYMPGGKLDDQIPAGGVDEATARMWMAQILKGLEALHKTGLVHRDLKPGNVLIDDEGNLRVTDLGIAFDGQRTEGTRTRLGARLGTPEYMAPEQIDGGAISIRTDLYAAGVVLFQMLTGEVPFAGDELDVMQAQRRQAPDLTVVYRKSPALASMVEQAMAKDPRAATRQCGRNGRRLDGDG